MIKHFFAKKAQQQKVVADSRYSFYRYKELYEKDAEAEWADSRMVFVCSLRG